MDSKLKLVVFLVACMLLVAQISSAGVVRSNDDDKENNSVRSQIPHSRPRNIERGIARAEFRKQPIGLGTRKYAIGDARANLKPIDYRQMVPGMA